MCNKTKNRREKYSQRMKFKPKTLDTFIIICCFFLPHLDSSRSNIVKQFYCVHIKIPFQNGWFGVGVLKHTNGKIIFHEWANCHIGLIFIASFKNKTQTRQRVLCGRRQKENKQRGVLVLNWTKDCIHTVYRIKK